MENLKEILDQHKLWLAGDGGECANLEDENLEDENLIGANLRYANLEGANLEGANLRGANLRGANLRGANLEGANLRGANLRGANLRGANLEGANLRAANLRAANFTGVIGNLREIKSLQIDNWPIAYTKNILSIGCKQFPIESWWGFDDHEIDGMSSGALKWWKEWKNILMKIIEISPADDSEQ